MTSINEPAGVALRAFLHTERERSTGRTVRDLVMFARVAASASSEVDCDRAVRAVRYGVTCCRKKIYGSQRASERDELDCYLATCPLDGNPINGRSSVVAPRTSFSLQSFNITLATAQSRCVSSSLLSKANR